MLVDLKLPAAESQPCTSAQAYQRAVPAIAVCQAVNFVVAAAAAEAVAAAAAGNSCLNWQRVECWQETGQTKSTVEAAESPSFELLVCPVLGLSWERREPDWTACNQGFLCVQSQSRD